MKYLLILSLLLCGCSIKKQDSAENTHYYAVTHRHADNSVDVYECKRAGQYSGGVYLTMFDDSEIILYGDISIKEFTKKP